MAPKVLKKKGYDGSKACDTSAYVAPKVLKKKGYDGSKANIWSSEVIFFALLSRYFPFQGENVMRIYSKPFSKLI